MLVLRGGRLVGERPTKRDEPPGAGRADGRARGGARRRVAARPPGPPALALEGVSTARRGTGAALRGVTLTLHAGEITGLAGVSGNGQAALAGRDCQASRRRPQGYVSDRRPGDARLVAARGARGGIGRIPEDRHAVGSIADMSVTENVISERYRSPRFSRPRPARLGRRAGLRRDADPRLRRALPVARHAHPSPVRRQHAEADPRPGARRQTRPSSWPTSRRAASTSAPSPMSTSAWSQARDRGAAVLLISEDLDEIMALSDRILVISGGACRAPSLRGERSIRDLGALMAGHGGEPEARRCGLSRSPRPRSSPPSTYPAGGDRGDDGLRRAAGAGGRRLAAVGVRAGGARARPGRSSRCWRR